MNSNPVCVICGSFSHFHLNKDDFDHYLCPNCELSFVYPQPLQKFLSDEVYSEKSGYQANKKPDLENAVPVKKHRKVLEYLSHQKPGKFLDIGCSNGEMIYKVKKMGYEVEGLELNSRTANMAKANGLKVFNGLLENAGFSDQSFDYVYMGDVIEHVTDPKKTLKEINRILRPGGQIILLTPNMDCFWAKGTYFIYRLARIPPSVFTPPHHLFNFSFGNLKKLLDDNGYVHKTTWYVGAPRLMYELGCLHLLKKYKQTRKFRHFAYMIFSYCVYTIFFGLNRIVELWPLKKFSMAMIAEKNA